MPGARAARIVMMVVTAIIVVGLVASTVATPAAQ